MDKVDPLVADLLDFMDLEDGSDAAFDELALRLFAHQHAANVPFRRFCQQRGATPRNVKSWRDIPAVPIDAFKFSALRCAPESPTERVFMTSGTTRGAERGRHVHPRLDVYDRSMIRNFARRFMRGAEQLPMGILFPDEAAMPNSSLAHYLALARSTFGAPDSRGFVTAEGLDIPALLAWLDAAQRRGEPCALLGASFSFVHLVDALRREQRSFRLPAGSRVLDTGGYKGQSRELPPEAFYAELSATLGVAAGDCINMYGMTELSTQFYDDGNARLPSIKSGPHWIRSRVIDPLTGCDVPAGERGILVHCDLGNYNSVTTILTEDVGVLVDGGFLLLGRASGTEAGGCSLAIDTWLKAGT